MPSESLSVFTIGHSTHTPERFLSLLREAGVTALADVRTAPFSRHFTHFNKDALKETLRDAGIAYVFLGNELGGRPRESDCYRNGVADYEKMALKDSFKKGLERVLEGAGKYRIAMMCSEQDPLDCHRCLLVGRALAEKGINVGHILADGSTITHRAVEEKLLALAGRESDDFFAPQRERLIMAYRERAMKVAFAEAEEEARTA